MENAFVERGGWWVVGQFILMGAIAVLGILFGDPSGHLLLSLCGLLFLMVSAISGLAAVKALGKNLTPFVKPAAQAAFVQRGIYGLMRHPLYTAVICAALGWSLIWSSWPALVASGIMAVFFDAKARQEERWLCGQFADYTSYQQRVRRFIPGVY